MTENSGKNILRLYGEILSPLKEELHYEEKLANWMLAISGSALILIAANFDKFQLLDTNININLY